MVENIIRRIKEQYHVDIIKGKAIEEAIKLIKDYFGNVQNNLRDEITYSNGSVLVEIGDTFAKWKHSNRVIKFSWGKERIVVQIFSYDDETDKSELLSQDDFVGTADGTCDSANGGRTLSKTLIEGWISRAFN